MMNLKKLKLKCTQNSQTAQNSQDTHTVRVGGGMSASVPSLAFMSSVYTIEQAVTLALPQSKNTSHGLLCKFAGALWAYMETTGKTIADDELRSIFRQWYDTAKPFLNPHESEDE